jgi:DNA-binding transcriptional LysR family regulator
MITVVSAEHPLAKIRRTIPKATIARHVQLVLTDRTTLSEGRDFGVLSPLTWRLADLGAKHAFLQAGFGWGHMPMHMVAKDLKGGSLVAIKVEGINARELFLPMHVVFRKDAPPGPAGRTFISKLRSK